VHQLKLCHLALSLLDLKTIIPPKHEAGSVRNDDATPDPSKSIDAPLASLNLHQKH
jgi:hypothetical protein